MSTRKQPPPPTASCPENSPIAWFGELLLALDRGDARHATEARRQLARLGWSVARKAAAKAPTPRHEADGPGVIR